MINYRSDIYVIIIFFSKKHYLSIIFFDFYIVISSNEIQLDITIDLTLFIQRFFD